MATAAIIGAKSWWARGLMLASAAIAVSCVILSAPILDYAGPSECAPLASSEARRLLVGLAASLLALGALSILAAWFAAARRGDLLAAAVAGEVVVGALAVLLFAWLAGGTSC